MTRQDYILHLDKMREAVQKIIDFDDAEVHDKGSLSDPTPLEADRAKKTRKMLDDLADRLYEDGAVSERVRNDKIGRGEFEQAEFTFTDAGGKTKKARVERVKEGGAE